MSHLSTETKVVYIPVLYDANDKVIHEFSEWENEEAAIADAHEIVAQRVPTMGYVYVEIKKRVIPIYI